MSLWDEFVRREVLGEHVLEWDGSTFVRNSYGEIVEAAERVAGGLRARGVGPGSIVAAVITNGPDAMPGYLGAWFAGATVASLPIIARGMTVPNYVAQLARLCSSLKADCLLAEERFLAFMPDSDELGVDAIGYKSLIETGSPKLADPPDPTKTVFIQFSSGTTGEPRGVELTGTAIEAQLRILADRVDIDPQRDSGYMWLPMSHDMGFFGCWLLAWYTGMGGVKSTPERFLQSPRSWFDDCARYGITVTAGPPFAINVATRLERVRSTGAELNLRLCLVGAEHIDSRVLEDAATVFGPRGLGLKVFTPAYGLAEATLAVTVGALDEEPRFVDVDSNALAEGDFVKVAADDPAARRLVSLGTPLAESDVRTDAQSNEVVVSSSSLASGYFANEHATEGRFRDGELWTGDIGFVDDGELLLTGRSDDLIIVGGRNVYVHELETSLAGQDGVRKGSCAIVNGTGNGRSYIALVAEVESDGVDTQELAVRLRRITMEAAGLPIDEFIFVPKGVFPKTPSGKAQRFRCREILAQPGLGLRVSLATAHAKT